MMTWSVEAERPLVSFIIPFYGKISLLKRCLDSIVDQATSDYEVVVVDDRSPESAASLVAEYGPKFRYVIQPENRGSYQARVRAVQESRGKYLIDVDCDDYFLPGLLSALDETLRAGMNDVVIFNLERDVGGVIKSHWCVNRAGIYLRQDVMGGFVDGRFQWCIFARAIRRELWVRTWEVEPELLTLRVLASDDYLTMLPIFMLSERIKAVDIIGYRYSDTPGSICNSHVSFKKVFRAVIQTWMAQRLLRRFAAKCGCPKETKNQVDVIAHKIIAYVIRGFADSLKSKFRCK